MLNNNIETNKEFIKKEGKCRNCNKEALYEDNPGVELDVDYDYDSIILCENCGYCCIRLYNEIISEGYFK